MSGQEVHPVPEAGAPDPVTPAAGPPPERGREPSEQRIDRRLLDFLVCPVTRGPLVHVPEAQELVSHRAGLAFPIVNGIPVMLLDEARRLED